MSEPNVINAFLEEKLKKIEILPIVKTRSNISMFPYLEPTLVTNMQDDLDELKMVSKTQVVTCRRGSVSVSSAIKQEDELKNTHGIDVSSMLENVMINETIFSITKHFTFKLKTVTEGKKPVTLLQKIKFFLLKLFRIHKSNILKVSENDPQSIRRLISTIMMNSNLIYHESRLGPANFMITNGKIATILQNSPGFLFKAVENPLSYGTGILYPAGNMGELTVYVDPNMKFGDGSIIMGRVTKDNEPGIKLVINEEATNITEEGTGTSTSRRILNTFYDVAVIGNCSGLYKKIDVKFI